MGALWTVLCSIGSTPPFLARDFASSEGGVHSGLLSPPSNGFTPIVSATGTLPDDPSLAPSISGTWATATIEHEALGEVIRDHGNVKIEGVGLAASCAARCGYTTNVAWSLECVYTYECVHECNIYTNMDGWLTRLARLARLAKLPGQADKAGQAGQAGQVGVAG